MKKRNRIYYALLVMVIMTSGLLSRKLSFLFPTIINNYLGDTLWALMIFFGFALLFPNAKISKLSIYALFFCFFIELTQLYHAPWIDGIRSTALGGLVLGYGFLWRDLLAYTVGVFIGALLDRAIKKE